MVLKVRIELTTFRLQNCCSANWAIRAKTGFFNTVLTCDPRINSPLLYQLSYEEVNEHDIGNLRSRYQSQAKFCGLDWTSPKVQSVFKHTYYLFYVILGYRRSSPWFQFDDRRMVIVLEVTSFVRRSFVGFSPTRWFVTPIFPGFGERCYHQGIHRLLQVVLTI